MDGMEATLFEHAVDRRTRRRLARDVIRQRDVLAASGVEQGTLSRDLVDALAAAVELGSADAFARHVCAEAAILENRGVPRARLDATLAALRSQLAARLPEAARDAAGRAVDAARLAAEAASFRLSAHVPARIPFARERDLFTDAALAGRWQVAYGIVDRLLSDGRSMLDVYADIVAESLYEVGRRWARAEISVADQHVASAVSDYVLGRLYTRLPVEEPLRGSAVVACAPTEAHRTGAHIVADALELDGWDVRFLGANAAPRTLVRAVEGSEASLVAVSASLVQTAARAARLIEELRERFGAAVRIVVGGGIFREVPDLWREVDADAFAADVRGVAGAARGARA